MFWWKRKEPPRTKEPPVVHRLPPLQDLEDTDPTLPCIRREELDARRRRDGG